MTTLTVDASPQPVEVTDHNIGGAVACIGKRRTCPYAAEWIITYTFCVCPPRVVCNDHLKWLLDKIRGERAFVAVVGKALFWTCRQCGGSTADVGDPFRSCTPIH